MQCHKQLLASQSVLRLAIFALLLLPSLFGALSQPVSVEPGTLQRTRALRG